MIVVAKSIEGAEYMYSAKSAHQVNGLSVQKMCEFLNKQCFNLREHEVWHPHDVGPYENAYAYGAIQVFEKKRNGQIVEKVRRSL